MLSSWGIAGPLHTFLTSLGASKLFFKITPAICRVAASACSLPSSLARETR